MATEICKHKAAYMADKSAFEIDVIQDWMITLIYVFTVLTCIFTIPVCCGGCPARSDRHPGFCLATLVVAGIAVCHVTYILGEQARFYYVNQAGENGGNHEWVATGFLLGIPGLCMMADWLYHLYGALYDGELEASAPAFVAVIILPILLPGLVVDGLLMAMVWVVDEASGRHKDQFGDDNGASRDLEAASEAATLVQQPRSSRSSTYGTMDDTSSKKPLRFCGST